MTDPERMIWSATYAAHCVWERALRIQPPFHETVERATDAAWCAVMGARALLELSESTGVDYWADRMTMLRAFLQEETTNEPEEP